MTETKPTSANSARRVQFSRSSTQNNIGERRESDGGRITAAALAAALVGAAQDVKEARTTPTSTGENVAPLEAPVAPIGGALDDDEDVEAAKKLTAELQLEMLRGKLARRNQIIEVIRRAYYHDVVVVKEELRNMAKQPTTTHSGEDKLSSVPSVDLRDVLPLFAPSETVLRVHPCETCGGHLELVHGEVGRSFLHLLIIAMAYTAVGLSSLEQGVAGCLAGNGARVQGRAADAQCCPPNAHRGQGDGGGERGAAAARQGACQRERLHARSAPGCAEERARAKDHDRQSSFKATACTGDTRGDRPARDRVQGHQAALIRSNHDRDIFSASNNHLKEELAEVTKALHAVKVEKAQLESDFGTSCTFALRALAC